MAECFRVAFDPEAELREITDLDMESVAGGTDPDSVKAALAELKQQYRKTYYCFDHHYKCEL